ncbi:unnamed protein product [Ambrosiozyma monospora]|uniref:Unnamed protein product n=1 Tax=Ambrosiozyma monospora TaxID=43982 RepID=A0ACB5SU84_AMBMO|nr:unnamed protein product [Ambrosiozyma monospora]
MTPTSLLTVTLALLVQKSFSYDFQSKSEGNGTTESKVIRRDSARYFIDLEIGSNHSPVAVALDTGSTDFWIPNAFYPDCTTYSCSQYGYFDGLDSSTFTNGTYPYYSAYSDGSTLEGVYVEDYIYFEGSELKKVTFGMSYNATNANGIMGLGPVEGSSSYTTSNGSDIVPTFPMALKDNGVIDKAAHFLALADKSSASILFGGVDHGRYTGDLAIVPMVNPFKDFYPDIFPDIGPLMPVTLNSRDVYDAENEILNQFSDALNITLPDSNTDESFPVVQCSEYTDYHLTFNFQGYEISVPFSKFLVTDDAESDTCYVIIHKSDEPASSLGLSFFSSVYVVFDLESQVIGLAPLNTDPSYRADIEAITDSIPFGTTVPGYSATQSYWPLQISTIKIDAESKTTKLNSLEPNSLFFNANATYGGNAGATFGLSVGSMLIGLSVLCCVFKSLIQAIV